MSHTLALLRHGQSIWNLENRFTGWHDSPLSEHGRQEALNAGQMLKQAGVNPDVVHTSLLVRAIDTAEIVLSVLANQTFRDSQASEDGEKLAKIEMPGIEMHSIEMPRIEMHSNWRLNERHYGDLTGLNKDETRAQYGKEQVHIWRRSYAVPPPPIADDNPWNPNSDPRYADIAPPLCESLADVTERLMPCFEEVIVPDLQAGKSVLVVAHGNSLRALVKHLDNISNDDILEVNIPTGVPMLYRLDSDMAPIEQLELVDRYLAAYLSADKH